MPVAATAAVARAIFSLGWIWDIVILSGRFS
jgi:hypothetical protein